MALTPLECINFAFAAAAAVPAAVGAACCLRGREAVFHVILSFDGGRPFLVSQRDEFRRRRLSYLSDVFFLTVDGCRNSGVRFRHNVNPNLLSSPPSYDEDDAIICTYS